MRRFLMIALALALAGCATGMSKKECLYADWHAVGYEDGARGAPATAVSPRRAACAKKAAMTVDMNAYLAGREEGLNEFCTPAKGFDLGAHGGRYDGVCSGRDEAAFTSAFASGRGLYERRAAVAEASNELASAEKDIDRLDHQITSASAALVLPTTPTEDRVRILADLKQMTDDRAKAKRALPGLRRDVDLAQRDLDAYENALAANNPPTALRPRPASY